MSRKPEEMTSDELSEHLLAYVKGRLAETERQDVERLVEADPAISAELAYLQSLDAAAALQRTADGDNGTGLGWARLSKALDGAGTAAGSVAANDNRARAWKWATLALGCVAAVQAIFLMQGLGIVSEDEARYVPVVEASAGYLVQVSFNPDAPEGQIRELLLQAGGELVSGPSAIGIYRVRFESQSARDAGLGQFHAARGIVEDAAPE